MTGSSFDPHDAAGRQSARLPANGLVGPSLRAFPPTGAAPSTRTSLSTGAGSSTHASPPMGSPARPDLWRLSWPVPASGGCRAPSQPPSAAAHRHPRPVPPPRAPPSCAATPSPAALCLSPPALRSILPAGPAALPSFVFFLAKTRDSHPSSGVVGTSVRVKNGGPFGIKEMAEIKL